MKGERKQELQWAIPQKTQAPSTSMSRLSGASPTGRTPGHGPAGGHVHPVRSLFPDDNMTSCAAVFFANRICNQYMPFNDTLRRGILVYARGSWGTPTWRAPSPYSFPRISLHFAARIHSHSFCACGPTLGRAAGRLQEKLQLCARKRLKKYSGIRQLGVAR